MFAVSGNGSNILKFELKMYIYIWFEIPILIRVSYLLQVQNFSPNFEQNNEKKVKFVRKSFRLELFA